MSDEANLNKVKKECKAAYTAVCRMKEERQEINEGIGERRQKLQAMGIPKAAFDMALKYANWDEDKRKGFDTAYSIVREAIGLPFDDQADLFIRDEDKGKGGAKAKEPDAAGIAAHMEAQGVH